MKKLIAHVILLCVAAGWSGCTCMPSEGDARDAYDAHRAALDNIEQQVKGSIGGLPRFAGAPPSCAEETGSASPESIAAENQCFNARSAWLEEALRAERRFESEVVVPMLDYPQLLGLQITMTSLRPNPYYPDDPPPSIHSNFGNDNANKGGSIPPENGVVIDGRKVGWGLGQIVCSTHDGTEYQQYGDADYHRQLDVAWEFDHENTHVVVAVHLLFDETPPQDWREHCLLP